ncbi:unnamed protein product, partial [Mesorhabditis belari]|uniref:C-type lectin domain-containing protein n=1 Tax=Mesorhabditis belari TaxID=2138241 RepID=A0AAF3F6Y8_9BILA
MDNRSNPQRQADLEEIKKEMSQLAAKISQNQAYLMGKIAKLEADLIDERERNRELETKIAETIKKNEDLEAQLKTQNTEERDGKAKIGELEGEIERIKTVEIAKLQADLNQTMTFLDLLDLERWSYLAKTDSWYKVIGQEMAFDEAEAYCASRRSRLVSIHSQEENDFVWKLVKTVPSNWAFWIGLKRNPNKGNAFEWMDGSSVNFTNWYLGEPDSRAHALFNSHTGKWAQLPPTYHAAFICKRSSQF